MWDKITVVKSSVSVTLLYTTIISYLVLVSFAQFLSKPKFSSVEKIKTIGSTYMAAAGLTQSNVCDDRKVIFSS